jgi:putative transposase
MYRAGIPYHVYNRGNNRQRIFFEPDNYDFFLDKMRKYLLPNAEILCYCLMPNHFHIQLIPTPTGTQKREVGDMQQLSSGIRQLLSSYTRGVNKRGNRSGSLFQQKTKSKMGWGVDFPDNKTYNLSIPFSFQLPYVVKCFRYIHLNPVRAKLVEYPFDWPHSSALDYVGERDLGVCNFSAAKEMLGISRLSSKAAYFDRLAR